MKNLKSVDLKSKKVFLRADLNVSRNEKGEIVSDFRLRKVIPTIDYILENGGKLILASHFGRPGGKMNEKFSLEFLLLSLRAKTGANVSFISDCIGEKVEQAVSELKEGEILLLENLRFHKEEKENDKNFAKGLADLADIYVNDAFSVCHRAHASVHAITDFLPSFPGFLLEKEMECLNKIKDQPEQPFVVIAGGAKISDKIGALENLGKSASSVLVGGALANTFLKANDVELGQSLFQETEIPVASKIMYELGNKLVLPVDGIFATKNKKGMIDDADVHSHDFYRVYENETLLDIGSHTLHKFEEILKEAKTIFWAGPMGYFENKAFAYGTKEVIEMIMESNAFSFVGGGDTVTAIEKYGVLDRFSHVSTGGSASLAYVAGDSMPGIEVLN